MLKKILATVLSTLPLLAHANFAPYVGGSIGIETNTSTNVSVPPNYIPATQSGNSRGVPLNGFIGYGGVFNQTVYLAAELDVTFWTIELSNENGLRTTYGYGASLLPGVLLSDHTLAFMRIGVARSRFTDASQTATGGKIGFGLQTTVTQNIDLRGEYDFVVFGSVNNSYGRISAPRADIFAVAILYKFD